MRSVLQDIHFGRRVLLKNPGFTAVAVLVLALGVGANTAIFSVANAVLLRPLPYHEPERLVVLSQTTPQSRHSGFSVADLFDFKEQSRSFEHYAAFYFELINLGGPQGTEQLPVGYVSSEFFAALGVGPAAGRAFTAEEDAPGGARPVIISHRVWQEQFGGAPDILRREVPLDGRAFEVVGVMPAGFHFHERVDLWLPMGLWPASRERKSHYALYAVARLKPGVTVEAAQAEVDAIAAGLRQQYPETNRDRGGAVIPLHEELVGDVRPSLMLLLAAVGLVLLVACANVANLLLARASARRREIAIRAALGASRLRIARQLLTESLLLALVGGALGVLLAFWGVDAVTAAGGGDVPRLAEPGALGIDRNVLAFSLGVSLVAGLVFGLAPALAASRPELVPTLKGGGPQGRAGGRLRGALVVAEVALALVLLVGTGLIVKSLLVLRGTNPGYDPTQVLTVGISLPRASYKDDHDRARFAQSALERLRALPGVSHAASSYPLPVYGMAWGMTCLAEGEPPPETGRAPACQTASVGPGFFSTLRIPLLQGRDFTEGDGREAEPVVVVDETLARRHWPNESPVGKHLTVSGDRPRKVVAVVGAVRNWGLREGPRPQIYIPHAQPLARTNMVPYVYLSLRTGLRPESLASNVRAEIEKVDRAVAVAEIKPMDELLDDSVGQQRFAAFLMQVFAGLALLLAGVGLYGVISYAVTQRTREIGIRVALGAAPRDVLRMVVGHGMLLTALGLGVGIAGALGLTRLMSGLLYGVSAADPSVYVAVAALLTLVALLACVVPARRATKVDPVEALRHE